MAKHQQSISNTQNFSTNSSRASILRGSAFLTHPQTGSALPSERKNDPSSFKLPIGQAKSSRQAHMVTMREGGMCVKKEGQELTVRCVFAAEGEDLEQLIARSLRLFVERTLLEEAGV